MNTMRENKFCIKKSVFVLSLALLLVGTFTIFSSRFLLRQNHSQESRAAVNQAVIYNLQLSQGLLTVENATARRDTIVSQLVQNPQTVLSNNLLLSEQQVNDLKSKNPSYVADLQKKGLMEEYLNEVRGIYTVYITDTFQEKSIATPMIENLTTDRNNSQTMYQLVTSKKNDQVKSGSSVSFVKTIILDNVLFSEEIIDKSRVESKVLGASTDRTLDYLVIPFYFKEDDPTTFKQPFTKADIEHQLFNQSNPQSAYNFYLKGSWGKTTVKGTVLDWMQIPESKNQYWPSTNDCAFDWWSNAVDKILKTKGDYSKYVKRIYIFPTNSLCLVKFPDTGEKIEWWGKGKINGDKIWVNGVNSAALVYSHEIGHNLGLPHAKLIKCGLYSIDDYDKCSIEEYGNPFDTMGRLYAQFNSVYKRTLQWLSDDSISVEISSDGDYKLDNVDNDTKPEKISLYRIKKGDTNENYYIEFRSITQFGQTPLQPKVMINVLHNDKTHLIKPYPLITSRDHSFFDVGDIFYDQLNGIIVSVKNISSQNATIHVAFNIKEAPTPTPNGTRANATGNSYCSNHAGIAKTSGIDFKSSWKDCWQWCLKNMTDKQPICQFNADGPNSCMANYAPGTFLDANPPVYGDKKYCVWKQGARPYGGYFGQSMLFPSPSLLPTVTSTMVPSPISTPQKLHVFVSSTLHDGNLGGVQGADKKCQSLADAAKLTGKFAALLASNDYGLPDNIKSEKIPYYSINNKKIADSFDDFLRNSILSPINLTEKGGLVIVDDKNLVFTGFNNIMLASGKNCNYWTSSDIKSEATLGSIYAVDLKYWLNIGPGVCAAKRHIYCIETIN